MGKNTRGTGNFINSAKYSIVLISCPCHLKWQFPWVGGHWVPCIWFILVGFCSLFVDELLPPSHSGNSHWHPAFCREPALRCRPDKASALALGAGRECWTFPKLFCVAHPLQHGSWDFSCISSKCLCLSLRWLLLVVDNQHNFFLPAGRPLTVVPASLLECRSPAWLLTLDSLRPVPLAFVNLLSHP